MSDVALLRPGIAAGAYPERDDVRESWLDRTTSAVFGALYQRFGPNHLDRGFLRQVASASEGLELLRAHELSEMASVLGRDLHCRGLQPDLVARAFAVIREVSGRTLGMRHFDVQLLGGWAMVR